MLWAQLKGKVAVQTEAAEDLLTSNVFGTLKYVPLACGILPVLSRAVGDGAVELRAILDETVRITTEFWPTIEEWPSNGCEPDVVLRLWTRSGQRAVVAVEAKYLSGKSSSAEMAAGVGSAPRDQLAREWVNCELLARRERAEAFVVFVTADHAFPAQELRESQDDLIRCGLARARLVWLSWRHVASRLDTGLELLADLKTLLETRYGFRAFEGVRNSARPLSWVWLRRVQPQPAFPPRESWPLAKRVQMPWLFALAKSDRDTWNRPPNSLRWRFSHE